MKLNKKGWGYTEFLIISAILLILLLIASYYIYSLYNALNGSSVNIYDNLETKLVTAAMEYDMDYDFNDIITSKKLINKKYLDGMYDNNGDSCTGYVKKEKKNLKAYIDCKYYQTSGYRKKYDK